MAFAGSPTSSDQFPANPSRPFGGETQGEVRIARFSYTHTAGNGTGEVNLVKLPPGRICIYSDLSHLITSQMAANADVHLGYRAHRKEDGTPVAEDDNALTNDLDTAGGVDNILDLPASGMLELESQEGVTIYMMVDTGNLLNGNVIRGWIAYTRL
jgi:hypothetical protein